MPFLTCGKFMDEYMTILLHEWMKNFFCETGILWMSESLKIGMDEENCFCETGISFIYPSKSVTMLMKLMLNLYEMQWLDTNQNKN